MGIYSPYAIAESEQPQWKPGENLAAAPFIGISLFLVLDVNVGIWRVFRKRTGYYYWSMQLGTLACAADALGGILKYLVPRSVHIWGLYTFLLLCGWSGELSLPSHFILIRTVYELRDLFQELKLRRPVSWLTSHPRRDILTRKSFSLRSSTVTSSLLPPTLGQPKPQATTMAFDHDSFDYLPHRYSHVE